VTILVLDLVDVQGAARSRLERCCAGAIVSWVTDLQPSCWSLTKERDFLDCSEVVRSPGAASSNGRAVVRRDAVGRPAKHLVAQAISCHGALTKECRGPALPGADLGVSRRGARLRILQRSQPYERMPPWLLLSPGAGLGSS
jgi:hypothetical protein